MTGRKPCADRHRDVIAERIDALAGMRLNTVAGSVQPGTVSGQQAAWKLGVSRRTVERYKARLRAAARQETSS